MKQPLQPLDHHGWILRYLYYFPKSVFRRGRYVPILLLPYFSEGKMKSENATQKFPKPHRAATWRMPQMHEEEKQLRQGVSIK